MATLLLRFAAPLQSWGIDSKFDARKTGREPSKSGVVGLLAAALGYRRDEADKLNTLNALRFGVRTDREGKLLCDFQMVHGEKDYVTYRYYLSDAIFLIGIEGEPEQLEELQYALTHPVFPLYLGRRSCPPTMPLYLGIRELPLEEALRTEPPLDKSPRITESMRITMDATDENAVAQHDLPLSFDPRRRQYGYREVAERKPVHIPKTKAAEQIQHDPFAELEDEPCISQE